MNPSTNQIALLQERFNNIRVAIETGEYVPPEFSLDKPAKITITLFPFSVKWGIEDTAKANMLKAISMAIRIIALPL